MLTIPIVRSVMGFR